MRALAGLGTVGVTGLPAVTSTVRAAIPGVNIEYKRCHVAFVSNASDIDSLAVYYADRDGARNVRYDIDPTETDSRGYEPLVVEYNADEDRTQIQLAIPRGSLVCITAQTETERTTQINPTDECVPDGFNTAPTASFTVSDGPTVGEDVTFTSTASDVDEPERLYYEWDLDGDGTYEATGGTVTTTYTEAGSVEVRHRVTDDCGASDMTAQTITISIEEELEFIKLFADDAESLDNFGFSVSLDGDTALVGANFEAPGGKDLAGSAYVFTRSGGTWSQQQKLTAADAEEFDGFGTSVSLDGDAALVGASAEDPDGVTGAGSAYVFTRSGGTWSQQQKLTAADAEEFDGFGTSVSLDGDTALVGASLEGPDRKSFAGSAYVFTRSGGTWSQQQKLTAADAEEFDRFGTSVSLDGDAALVGAPQEDPDSKDNAGSAYVFTRSGGTWSQQQKLTAADAEAGDEFGTSVSTGGDTVLVGAPEESPDSKDNAGSAYVFEFE